MKIVLAPNTFKESLSANGVAQAMCRGVWRVDSTIDCAIVPLADGGDGTTDALVSARGGEYVEITVNDPLMRPVPVKYGLIDGGRTAVMEMAAASGLWRLSEGEKNPFKTTTFGTGEMMRDAMLRGVETIILGIGGSATTDAGIGMAAALGYRFLDSGGNALEPVGGRMNEIVRIDAENKNPLLDKVKIYIACDVTNPLLGAEGAAPVYGPQKGATPEMVLELERGLARVAECCERDLDKSLTDLPGGGAAGGLGAGLVGFCNAELRPGFDLIADYARLDESLTGADLIITGEGKIDVSTRFGKVPAGVAKRAKKLGVPVIALAGSYAGDLTSLHEAGITAIFSIVPGPIGLEDAMENAREYVAQATEQVVRIFIRKRD